jgi:hypothetical protein
MRSIGAGFPCSLSDGVLGDEIKPPTKHVAVYFEGFSDRGSIPLTSTNFIKQDGVFSF